MHGNPMAETLSDFFVLKKPRCCWKSGDRCLTLKSVRIFLPTKNANQHKNT